MAVDYEIDCVVAGAGAIGLAVARELAQSGREVLIVEADEAFGRGVSSRSSEVIHAGMYYTPGSLRAQLCVEGKWLLYDFMKKHNVSHSNCGKLIVACEPDEVATLEAIISKGAANGVNDLELLDESQARALEPELKCVAAILSPSTGMMDSAGVMLALLGEAENAGATLATRSPVAGGRVGGRQIEIDIGGAEPMTVGCNLFVNSTSLNAPQVASSLEGLDGVHVPTAYYGKGSYFSIAGKVPFSRLIYPCPVVGGLGVHLTIDVGGQARFGPDVEWVDEPNYNVDPARGDEFYAMVRRYWPALPDGALQPSYAGVRPKIVPPGNQIQDFRIDGPEAHGVPGLINLFGMESPGLTSSLAIGRYVVNLANCL
ncbi:MAG: NAD(P)/FAD-dependent oxidoreductase [Anderseniella sp.]|nr:NAD(P)/FAD-dependent oxidoreductase [Anderseniella sp.]